MTMRLLLALLLTAFSWSASASYLIFTVSDTGPWDFSDLTLSVKGPVKRITETYARVTVDGKEEPDKVRQQVFEFDRSGQLIKMADKGSDSTEYREFTWENNRRVKIYRYVEPRKSSPSTETFTYDHDGCLLRSTLNAAGDAPRVAQYKCTKTATGTRRVNLADPDEFKDFDKNGRIVFIQEPKTQMLNLAPNVAPGKRFYTDLTKRRITYSAKDGHQIVSELDVSPEGDTPVWIEFYMADVSSLAFSFLHATSNRSGYTIYQYDAPDVNGNWVVRTTSRKGIDAAGKPTETHESTTYRSVEYWQ